MSIYLSYALNKYIRLEHNAIADFNKKYNFFFIQKEKSFILHTNIFNSTKIFHEKLTLGVIIHQFKLVSFSICLHHYCE